MTLLVVVSWLLLTRLASGKVSAFTELQDFAMAEYNASTVTEVVASSASQMTDHFCDFGAPVRIADGSVLQLCRAPMDVGRETAQGKIFGGKLTPSGQKTHKRVVVKFYLKNPKVPSDMAEELKVAKTLNGLPFVMKFLGALETEDVNKLRSSGQVNLGPGLVPPGAIYEYIPGRTVSDFSDEFLSEYEVYEEGVRHDLLPLQGLASCLSYQMVLSHLLVLSKGLYNQDAHLGNFMVRSDRKFRPPGSSEECDFVEMIDLGIFRKVSATSLPDKLKQALFQHRTFALSLFKYANAISESQQNMYIPDFLLSLLKKIAMLRPEYADKLLSINQPFSIGAFLKEKNEGRYSWVEGGPAIPDDEKFLTDHYYREWVWVYRLYRSLTADPKVLEFAALAQYPSTDPADAYDDDQADDSAGKNKRTESNLVIAAIVVPLVVILGLTIWWFRSKRRPSDFTK